MPDSTLFLLTALAGIPVGLVLADLSLRMADAGPAPATTRRRWSLALICAALALWAGAAAPGPRGVMGAILAWQLVLLVVLDIEHFWLPRLLTGFLIVSGLLTALAEAPDLLIAHALGAAAGFVLLAGVALAYRILRGREGLGGGDAWLLAGGGAWTGWYGLPSILILASLAGLIQVGRLAARGKPAGGHHPVPFGVGLSAGIWLVWVFGSINRIFYSASLP